MQACSGQIDSRVLAVLAQDVYGEGSAPPGFTRQISNPGCYGFYGAIYRSQAFNGGKPLRCLVLRGSDDLMDWALANPQMIPRSVREAVADQWRRRPRIDLWGIRASLRNALAESILSNGLTGRMPMGQAGQAWEMYAREKRRGEPVDVVTGHSLGGALAAYVGQRAGIPAVTFNAPKIGLLDGTVPATFASILHVNATKDIVSNLSGRFGSLPVGEVLQLQVPSAPSPSANRNLAQRSMRIISPTIRAGQDIKALVEQLKYYHGMDALIRVGAGSRSISINQ